MGRQITHYHCQNLRKIREVKEIQGKEIWNYNTYYLLW
jgi:hypothetical protein